MKKFILFGFSGLLILVFATLGYGQALPKLDFRASGLMDVLSVWSKNVAEPPWNTSPVIFGPHTHLLPTGPAFDKTHAYMESRARLRFDAVMGKELQGTIYFEVDSLRWGEVAGTGAQRNQAGQWGADRAAVEVKNAFITFAVPVIPIPMQVHAGILPFAFRSGYLLYNDGAGIQTEIKVDPVGIRLVWGKMMENQDWAADDDDVYGVDVNAKIGKLTVGGFGLNYNMNTYPVDLPTAVFPGTSTVDFKANFWWLGLYADGRVGPVDINFDLGYDTGKVEDSRNIAPRARDVKYSGWLTRLKVDYPWEKFNFGLIGMYSSGADTRKTSATGLPGELTSSGVTSSRVGGWVVPPWSEHGYGDSVVFYPIDFVRSTPGFSHSPATTVAGGYYGGSWFAKLYGSYRVAPWYKVTLAALYIGDTTQHGNSIGNARKAPFGASNLRDDKTIGWEFNLRNDFQIYKNLTWWAAGGALLPGDAMDYFNSSTRTNVSPKIPWAVVTKLTYVF